ncbi:MAG TPA: PAS domain S-box protein [Anaerolineae bacterium]|nr:PAS domain S-box protein [Anaerolineae bacterium]
MVILLRILFLEDQAADVDLILHELQRAGFDPTWQRVETEADFLAQLRAGWDVILANYALAHLTAPRALQLLQESGLDIPFIVVSDAVTEELAVAVVRQGAADYLHKERVARLGPAVARALAQKQLRDEQRGAAAHIEHLNRMLRALRAIDLLITQQKDPPRLLQQACETLLKTRDYTSASIGLIKSGYKHIITAARAGHASRSIEEASSGGSITESDPVSTAIRTRQPIVLHHLADDRDLLPNPAATPEPGRLSLAVIPMLHADRLFGVLNVSTPSERGFDPEEVALLLELGGDLAFALQSLEDEAARKRAEEALHANARRFRALIEKSADAIALLGRDSVILYVSPSISRLLGYTSEEFVGRNALELLHTDDSAPTTQLFTQLVRELGSSASGQVQVQHKDGSWRWIEVVGTNLLSEPSVHAIVVNFRDVTDRRQAEDALREGESLNQAVLNSLAAHIAVLDNLGNIVSVNEAWERFARENSDPEQARPGRGVNYVDVVRKAVAVGDAEAAAALAGIQAVLSGAQALFTLEYTSHSATEKRWFLLHATPLSGGQRGAVLAHTDITERKQREYELEAIVSVAAALRAAPSRADILPVILNQVLALLKVDGAALVMRRAKDEDMVVALARGVWADWTGKRIVPGEGLSGYIVARASNRPYLNNDIAADPHLSRSALTNDLRAVACVPLIAEKHTLGVLGVGRQAHIADSELRLLTVVGDIAANALYRAALHEETERRAEQLATLNTFGRALTEILDPLQIYAQVQATIFELMPDVAGLFISLYDSARQLIRCVHANVDGVLLDATTLPGLRLEPPGVGTQSEAIHTRRPLIVNDLHARLERVQTHIDVGTTGPLARSGLYVPMLVKGAVSGVVQIQSYILNRFSPADAELLSAVANQAAIALENTRLYEAIHNYTVELEQRVAERTVELQRERERLQAILDAAGEGIAFTDQAWRIEYTNPAIGRLTGYTAEELRGKTPDVWQSHRMPAETLAEMLQTTAQGETWHGEVIHRRKDGAEYDAALTLTPLRGVDDEIAGFVGIQRDITRQKELERMRSKFVSDVSHELRTPVGNLKLYVDLLEHGKPNKRDHYMQVLKEQADRLVQLVEDILNLSRLELGAQKAQFVPVSLNPLAEQIILAYRASAELVGLRLIFTPGADLPAVQGESNQLAQVITNLIANAIHYTAHGQIEVSTHATAGQVCLEVRDTGNGIEPQDMPHLFERFYRGKHVGQSDKPGSGLGLAIVKEIVDLHGGRIEAESTVGQGSIFRVYLPPASYIE